jgi:hypothetical protein
MQAKIMHASLDRAGGKAAPFVNLLHDFSFSPTYEDLERIFGRSELFIVMRILPP